MKENQKTGLRHRCALIGLTATAMLAFSATSAIAGPWNQSQKILPGDGAPGDNFGGFIAIDGTTAIVGAPGDDDNGADSGSAYVIDLSTGQQLFKLHAADGQAGDIFGAAVAISGTTAIVSAFFDDDNGLDSGSAYLFDVSTGQQLFKLLPADGGSANDFFGLSVGISGTTAIVGVPHDSTHNFQDGSAYLFDTTTGAQIAKIVFINGLSYDLFGVSVAINGSIAAVGASFTDDVGTNSGTVYVYDLTNPSSPVLASKLNGTTEQAFDRFGESVAISGTTIIVGSPNDADNGPASGSAYLFDISTPNTPTEIAKLLPSDGAADDKFGWFVGIDGSTAITGAFQNDDNGLDSGSAYLFDTSTGAQIAKLLPNDGAAGDHFGYFVAIQGSLVLCGATGDDDNGLDSGSAYLFKFVPQLSVAPDPLLGGQIGTFTVTDLTPTTTSYLGYSTKGIGSTYIGALDVTLDMNNPKQAGPPMTSDANGMVEWMLRMPPVTSSIPIWFQAVQMQNKTAVVATQIDP